MKTNIEDLKPLPNRRSGASADRRQLKNRIIAALCRDAATKPVGNWMFSVKCWMLNVAVFATAASTLADVHYVDVNSTNATPPYTTWSTAATDIQSAVDAAVAGDEVVVTNGTYAPVIVNKQLNVLSVNGPQFTTIDARGRMPCAWLFSGVNFSGFTLTHGYASDSLYDAGGVFCTATAVAVVSNCIVTQNYTQNGQGGGARGCTLNNCTLSNNRVRYGSGGGAAWCTLNNCTLSGNLAQGPTSDANSPDYAAGGGAYQCTLNNCTLTGNSALYGGGAYFCALNNCTLTGNSFYFLGAGGGTYSSTLNNCISFGNYYAQGYCEDCDSPGSPNGNNWYGDPQFVDFAGGNLHLQPNSPCINAGDNSYVTSATDLDGNPRISGGTVDIGAYEYQWPQLTLTPSDIPPGGIVLTWPTNNLGYDYTGFTVQSTTNLVPPLVWDTNSPAPVVINGQNVVTNPIPGPQQFYRLVK
jgi:hypothetical protein